MGCGTLSNGSACKREDELSTSFVSVSRNLVVEKTCGIMALQIFYSPNVKFQIKFHCFQSRNSGIFYGRNEPVIVKNMLI